MNRFYILPMVGSGSMDDMLRPKYLQELRLGYSSVLYDKRKIAICCVSGTKEQHAALSSKMDVFPQSENIDTKLGDSKKLERIMAFVKSNKQLKPELSQREAFRVVAQQALSEQIAKREKVSSDEVFSEKRRDEPLRIGGGES